MEVNGYQICEKANLAGANLGDTDLHSANFAGANLRGAILARAQLHSANFAGANLEDAYLDGSVLSNANFVKANLKNTNIRSSIARGANFSSADLSSSILCHTNFCGANLMEANFTDSNLTGAELNDGNLYRSNFLRAILWQVNLTNSNLYLSNFTEAQIADALILGSQIETIQNLFGHGLVFKKHGKGLLKMFSESYLDQNHSNWRTDDDEFIGYAAGLDWTSRYLASGKFDEHSEIQIEFAREYESDDSGDFSLDRQAEQLAWQRENEMGLSGMGETWDDSL